MVLSLLLFLCLTLSASSAADEQCTKARVFDKGNKTFVEAKTFCNYGCCGVYPNQSCCAMSVGVAAGGLGGAIVALSLIGAVICWCVKKHSHTLRAVEPEDAAAAPVQFFYPPYRPRTPHHTSINVFAGPFPQYCAWGRGGRNPVQPPPYLDRGTPPPDYSTLQPSAPSLYMITLPRRAQQEILLQPPGAIPSPRSESSGHRSTGSSESDTDGEPRHNRPGRGNPDHHRPSETPRNRPPAGRDQAFSENMHPASTTHPAGFSHPGYSNPSRHYDIGYNPHLPGPSSDGHNHGSLRHPALFAGTSTVRRTSIPTMPGDNPFVPESSHGEGYGPLPGYRSHDEGHRATTGPSDSNEGHSE